MVFTLPVVITIVVVALASLSVTFRTWLLDLAGGAADYAIGSWPIIRRALFWAAIIGGIGWLLLIVLMFCVGAYANSIVSALIISFLFPVWFMAFIMPPFANRLWVIGPIMRGMRTIGSPVLVVATIVLLVGIWSPEVKGSLDRWSQNQKQTLANKLDKSSLQSEPESGVIATLAEETVLYDNNGNAVWKMPKGTRVMILDLRGYSKTDRFEGMTRVMLENKYGDFANGNRVFVPSKKIQM